MDLFGTPFMKEYRSLVAQCKNDDLQKYAINAISDCVKTIASMVQNHMSESLIEETFYDILKPYKERMEEEENLT